MARRKKFQKPQKAGPTVFLFKILLLCCISLLGDLRRQFLNMAFLTYAAYDFAADARGYTWGLVGEYFHDRWAIRFGHAATPVDPNQLPTDTRIFAFYGQQVEI